MIAFTFVNEDLAVTAKRNESHWAVTISSSEQQQEATMLLNDCEAASLMALMMGIGEPGPHDVRFSIEFVHQLYKVVESAAARHGIPEDFRFIP